MIEKEPVKLLILEASQNRAEELIVLLRTAGRATRAHQITSLADLVDKLKTRQWDLLLASNEANGLSAQQAISTIRELDIDIPVILLAEGREIESITEGMKIGAIDVALGDDDERLGLIIRRELQNLENRRLRRRAEVRLRETARRNQLLLDSSSAAIAYVHEGMHIYTNNTYAELFGYRDPDDFAGIPIIDLIAVEDQETFKNFLKSFDHHGEDVEGFACVSSDGSKILSSLALSPDLRRRGMHPGYLSFHHGRKRTRKPDQGDIQPGFTNGFVQPPFFYRKTRFRC